MGYFDTIFLPLIEWETGIGNQRHGAALYLSSSLRHLIISAFISVTIILCCLVTWHNYKENEVLNISHCPLPLNFCACRAQPSSLSLCLSAGLHISTCLVGTFKLLLRRVNWKSIEFKEGRTESNAFNIAIRAQTCLLNFPLFSLPAWLAYK